MHYLQTWLGWSFASSINSAKYPPCTRHWDRPERSIYLLLNILYQCFCVITAVANFIPHSLPKEWQPRAAAGAFHPVFSAFVKRASLKVVYPRRLVLRTGCGSLGEHLPSIPLAPAQTANHSNNNKTDPLPFVLIHQIQLCATSKYWVSFLTYPKPQPSVLITFCWGGGSSV